MIRRCLVWAAAALLLPAQEGRFDSEAVALIYHKITGEPLDFTAAVERTEPVQQSTNFDRRDVLKAEVAKLQARLAAVDPLREFVVKVNDDISEYDHDRASSPSRSSVQATPSR